jgi:putative thiamine transport system ATP-binding protein
MNSLILEQASLVIAGQRLFAPVDLRVAPGTIISITGRNGVGKSSLLAFVCGTLPADFDTQGRVLLGKEDITHVAPEARGVGILFQEPLLFPHLDVGGNLLFGLRSGNSRRERRVIVQSALKSMGIDELGERDPATLSGGQKARVALLRVLLSEPRALLLDEPFAALDDATRPVIRRLVFDEIRRRELPALLVSHDGADVADTGGPVIVLEN